MSRSYLLRGACAALGSSLLAGCVDTAGQFRSTGASIALARAAIASPRGASVAMASLDGAPAAVNARFAILFAAAAAARDMPLAESAVANYLVRGYLSAYPVEDGTAIGYVWDVFDTSKRRTRRVTDAIIVTSTDPDAWQLASTRVLESLAAKSADDLALFLAETPEALAFAKAAAPAPNAPAPNVPTPLAFAPAVN